jgi:hypothetical protein
MGGATLLRIQQTWMKTWNKSFEHQEAECIVTTSIDHVPCFLPKTTLGLAVTNHSEA